jgi:aldehyde:ferredoxin oxidoreductase
MVIGIGAAEDAMHGYHGRILHVNLTNGQTHIETFDETFA